MSIEQSWRIAYLTSENERLQRNMLWLDAYRERCRSLACSLLVAEGRCESEECRSSLPTRDWCDEVLSLAEPN